MHGSIDKWHHQGECLSGFEDLLPSSTFCFAINLIDVETWDDAENICRNISQYHGGHLVTISSLEVNSAILKNLVPLRSENMTSDIWIGLQKVDYEKGSTFKINMYYNIKYHIIIFILQYWVCTKIKPLT